MTVRRTSGWLTGLVLLAVATGCGSDSDGAATGSTPAPTSTGATSAPAPSQSEQPVAQDSPAKRQKVKLDASGGGAGVALCTLFSTAEISERLGKEVGEGKPGGPLNSLCRWEVTGGESGYVQIQRVPADFYVAPTGSAGYKELRGVGKEGYVDGTGDDWEAAALHGDVMTSASLARSSKATPAGATALLKETLTRG